MKAAWLIAVLALSAGAEEPSRYRVGKGRARVSRCDLRPSECSASVNPTTIAPSGLRAWWSGNDLSATEWRDSSGNEKPLTLAAAGAAPTGYAQAWEFNGYGATKFYATDAEYAEVATASDWTFLTQSAGHTGYVQFVLQQTSGGILASMFGSSTANGSGLGIWITTQQLSMYIAHASSGFIASYSSAAGFLTYGVPTTIVWRLNGTTNKFNIRVNGVQVNDSAAANYTNTAPAQKLRIGKYSTPTNSSPFGGLVSDFVLWDRPLSDVEVTALEAWGNRTATSTFATDAVTLSPPLTGTVKVMFIGDSITEGITGATTLVGGYRHRVFDLNCGLADTGSVIDGIGPYVGTLVPNGYADNQSNGKSAATVKGNALVPQKGHATGSSSCVDAPGGCINTMIGSGNTYRPDVIAVMLGTNDILGISEAQMFAQNTAGNWCDFVSDMHTREPTARFVLSSVTPQTSTGKNMQAPFNRALQSCAMYLRSQGTPLVLVDSYGAITNPAAQLFDGVHPNDTGYGLIGDAFCPAIRRAMGYTP